MLNRVLANNTLDRPVSPPISAGTPYCAECPALGGMGIKRQQWRSGEGMERWRWWRVRLWSRHMHLPMQAHADADGGQPQISAMLASARVTPPPPFLLPCQEHGSAPDPFFVRELPLARSQQNVKVLVYIFRCARTHTHMLTHTTNANKHTHTKTYARHMHTHRCTHVHTHTHADAHTCAYTHPRTHPPPKKYTQTHTHTHAHERAHTTHQSVQKPDMSAPAAQQLLGALQHQAPPPLAATPLHQLAAVALGCPLRRSCPAPRWPCTQQWLLCALCQHAVATALALPPQLIAAQ